MPPNVSAPTRTSASLLNLTRAQQARDRHPQTLGNTKGSCSFVGKQIRSYVGPGALGHGQHSPSSGTQEDISTTPRLDLMLPCGHALPARRAPAEPKPTPAGGAHPSGTPGGLPRHSTYSYPWEGRRVPVASPCSTRDPPGFLPTDTLILLRPKAPQRREDHLGESHSPAWFEQCHALGREESPCLVPSKDVGQCKRYTRGGRGPWE